MRATLLLFVLCGTIAAQTHYTARNIPKLGFSSINNASLAINDSGQVTGRMETSKGVFQPFVWSASTGTVPLGFPQVGTGINNQGQVVGYGSLTPGTSGVGYLWSQGSITVLPSTPAFGGSAALPSAVNNSDTVIGYPAFVWSEAAGLTDLTPTLGLAAQLLAINATGTVVGYYTAAPAPGFTHAMIWDSVNGARDIQNSTLAAQSAATAINDNGVVVGWFTPVGTTSAHVFVWTEEAGMSDLTPTGNSLRPTGINNAGQIVGTDGEWFTCTGRVCTEHSSDGLAAWICTLANPTLQNLDTMAGITTQQWNNTPVAINNVGQVLLYKLRVLTPKK